MTVRIDADIICYRASSATDGKKYVYRGHKYETIKEMVNIFGKDFQRVAAVEEYNPEPWSHARKIIDNIMEDYPFSQSYVGGQGNFRYRVATIKDYKGNRKQMRRPYHLDAAKQYLVDEYEAKLPKGPWETDDQIALDTEEGDTIVTLDKDYLQLPDIKLKDIISGKVTETTKASALTSLYTQALTGDTADNIPGAYNCGEKSVAAKKMRALDSEDEMDYFHIVATEYKKRYHNYGEQWMTENLKLLYLLRKDHLDWVTCLGAMEFYDKLMEVI